MEREIFQGAPARLGLLELFASDRRGGGEPRQAREVWGIRFFIAALFGVMAFTFSRWAPALYDREMASDYFTLSMVYVVGVPVGALLFFMSQSRAVRFGISMAVMFLEFVQLGLGFYYLGPLDASTYAMLLCLVTLYPTLVGFWHGVAAALLALALQIAKHAAVIWGLLSPHGAFVGDEFRSVEYVLVLSSSGVLISITACVSALFLYLGATLRLRERSLEEQSLFIARQALTRYLPTGMAEELMNEGSEWAVPHRRRVTVFFSDIVGFVGQAEQMDPVELAAVLDEYLEMMVEVAHRHGGAVDKFIGDSVMVIFGAPISMEPDEQARAAVRMALEMQRRIERLSRRWGGFDAATRMGVHQGEAAVGTFGGPSRSDFTVIGDTVNVASRLEVAAGRGSVWVSGEVWELLNGRFEGRSIGSIVVKNRAEEVVAWEVIAEAGGGE